MYRIKKSEFPCSYKGFATTATTIADEVHFFLHIFTKLDQVIITGFRKRSIPSEESTFLAIP